MKALLNWIDDRTGVAKLTKEALFENIPGGARWRYVWGSTLTFAIMVQFITGIMLWMFYSPSTNTAWESVNYIQNEVAGGDWLRGIHHWTAQVMIILLVLHLVQVVIDGAYKAPREFNFWFGLGLLGITLALGLTGYLLPWDQKGFWATEVATNILANTPLIGDELKQLAIGGNEYGHQTLTRFFALHAGVLPGALVGLIVLHIYLFRKHGITPAPAKTAQSTMHFWWVALSIMLFAMAMLIWNWTHIPNHMGIIIGALFFLCLARVLFLHIKRDQLRDEDSKKPRRGDEYFWPSQIFRDAVACAAVMGAVLFFVWQYGTHLSSPADPSENYSAARPDWYFMSLFYLLKKVDIFTGAFVIPGIVSAFVFAMPLLGRWKVGHWINIVVLSLIMVVFVWGTLLAFRHDWTNDDVIFAVAAAERDAARVKELAGSPDGIPPEGALSLLRKDPYTQGPKLFAQKCASCHAYGGHDGTGKKRMDKQVASDLRGFGSREWIEEVLDSEKFASVHYFGGTPLIKGSKMLKFLKNNFDPADMEETDKEDLNNIVIALSAEAKLKSQTEIDAKDEALITEGRELMLEDGLACTDCHTIHGEGKTRAPLLTGYASRDWTINFIKNPEHADFYPRKKVAEDATEEEKKAAEYPKGMMPVFGPKIKDGKEERPAQLSEKDIELIVDWIRGDYYTAPKEK